MYYLVTGEYECEDKKYTGYGIGYENIQIEDITTDKNEISILIDKMNSEELNPVHMYDVIYDFIG